MTATYTELQRAAHSAELMRMMQEHYARLNWDESSPIAISFAMCGREVRVPLSLVNEMLAKAYQAACEKLAEQCSQFIEERKNAGN